MDLTTVIGTLLVAVLLFWSMTAGGTPIALFIDAPSLVMVAGGTLAVTMMSFRLGDLKGLVSVILRSYLFKLPSPGEEIERVISYANLARKEGLLALEAKLEEVDDKFFSKGVQLVIDGFGADAFLDEGQVRHERLRQVVTHGTAAAGANELVKELEGHPLVVGIVASERALELREVVPSDLFQVRHGYAEDTARA